METVIKHWKKSDDKPNKVYRNQSQPLDIDKYKEVNKLVSKTIPGQAMSTREILHRYTSGGSLNVNVNEPVYLTNVPLYDTRRKHNIDIAVDKSNNEKKIMQQQKEVFDNTTAISELTQKRKKALLKAETQEVKPTPKLSEE